MTVFQHVSIWNTIRLSEVCIQNFSLKCIKSSFKIIKSFQPHLHTNIHVISIEDVISERHISISAADYNSRYHIIDQCVLCI